MSSFSNWREDLREIVDSDSEDQNEKEIKEKKVKNKIDINPSIRESIESIGGQLIDIREISEGKCDDCTCEGCGPDGVGHQNPCIECGGHHKEEKEVSESVAAGIALSPQELQIQRKKAQLDVRLAKKRQQSMNKIEKDSIDVEKQAKDVDVQEKVLDKFETGEKERIVKGMKKDSEGLKKRYGDKWKNVMYATATKRAKEAGDTSKSDKRYAAEDKAFSNVVAMLQKKHGKDSVITKDNPPKKPTEAQKKAYSDHRAKLAKQDRRDDLEKSSQGRYSRKYSNVGSD